MYAVIPAAQSICLINSEKLFIEIYGELPNFKKHNISHIFLSLGTFQEIVVDNIFHDRLIQIIATQVKTPAYFNTEFNPTPGTLLGKPKIRCIEIKYGSVYRVSRIPKRAIADKKMHYLPLIDFNMVVVGKNLVDISQELAAAKHIQEILGDAA